MRELSKDASHRLGTVAQVLGDPWHRPAGRRQFEDAVIVAQMERQRITEVVSYDTDFDRIRSIERKEPALHTAA